jgi:hypothetical protein
MIKRRRIAPAETPAPSSETPLPAETIAPPEVPPPAADSAPSRSVPWRWPAVPLAVVMVAGGIWFFFKTRQDHFASNETPTDPRLTFSTPFRNVHPDVKYVGDKACAGCHKELTHSFHQHSMGRSVTPIAEMAPTQNYDESHHNPFPALGKEYFIERDGDKVLHKETFKAPDGRALVQTQAEVQFAIGSGSHACSYLILRGDRVIQSPITWYPQKHRWDLSPGFHSAENADNAFSRPVGAECLFCHSNRVEPIEGSMNRYQMPLFPQGAAIGCERCHGPGELHVRERTQNLPIVDKVDHTIVNPRHLDSQLREDVCHQCHLEGNQRVLRRGLAPFDYRPGLPLHLFYSTLVVDQAEQGTFTGHVEQMHSSRCFTASEGKMGCVTCHNPHEPLAQTKPSLYRQQCINCHLDKGCSLPVPERQKNQDNCLACHMPKQASADIQHTAISDHRILKSKNATHGKPARAHRYSSPLVHFESGPRKLDDAEARRDLAIALTELLKQPGPSNQQIAELALPMIEETLKRWPGDLPALEAKAYLLYQHGRPKSALETIEQVLAHLPRRESALSAAANYAVQAGDPDKALAYSREAANLNPYLVAWRYRLADLYMKNKQYEPAITECRDALRLNPGAQRLRTLLITVLVQNGQATAAQEELETLQKMKPANKAELQQWFDKLRR